MQKIFSARLEEAVIHEMDEVTRRLGITKRQFLEEAIRRRVEQLNANARADVWSETLGAWQRKETPEQSIGRARRAFRKSFERHHRGGNARLLR